MAQPEIEEVVPIDAHIRRVAALTHYLGIKPQIAANISREYSEDAFIVTSVEANASIQIDLISEVEL